MKAGLALAAALVFSLTAAAGIVIEEFPASLTLKQSVRLGDGSVLPAGLYDVRIQYKGFGNAAEFHFFQGGVLKGKTPAEARGFPSQPPASPARKSGEGQKDFLKYEQKGVKMDSASTVKLDAAQKADIKFDGIKGESTDKDHKTEMQGAPQDFSWGAHGFNRGMAGKASVAGNSVKLQFDSANSAAGFSALLPAVKK